MHEFFTRLLDLIRDHGNLAIALLAWVVAAEAVIIVLWSRRARSARSQLAIARQAAENAQALAAATLASDERMLTADPQIGSRERAEPPALAEVELAAVAARGDMITARPHTADSELGAHLPPAEVRPLAPHQNGDVMPAAAPFGGDADWASAAPLTPARDDPGWTPGLRDQPTPGWLSSPTDETASPPVAEGEDATWVAAPVPPDPGPADSASEILLVEDDENVAKLYRLLLESRGYTVHHAADGLLALEEVERHRPDLILLDVMMPRMGGLDFLESLRSMNGLADVPVVVLSNFRNPEFVERALSLGALEYMVKAQTRPESFISAIPHWVRGRRAFSA